MPPPAAPPERVEHTVRVVGTDVVRIEPPPPPEPEPAVEPEPPVAPEPSSRPRRFFARLFPRIPQPEPPAPPAPERGPEPPAPQPYELRVVHAVVACRVPERPAPEPPPAVQPAFDVDRATALLADVLDRLGAAHHRPFSRS